MKSKLKGETLSGPGRFRSVPGDEPARKHSHLREAEIAIRAAVSAWHFHGDSSLLLRCLRWGVAFPGKWGQLLTVARPHLEAENPGRVEDVALALRRDGHQELAELLEKLIGEALEVSSQPRVFEDALQGVLVPHVSKQLGDIALDGADGKYRSVEDLIDAATSFREIDAGSLENLFTTVRSPAEIPETAPPTFAIEGLLYANAFSMVGGDPKAGKTNFCLEIALGYLTGKPVLDTFEVKDPGAVVFIQADMGAGLFGYVLQQLALGKGIGEEGFSHAFHFACSTTVDLVRPEIRSSLLKRIEILKPRLVVLDPLRDLHSADENSSDELKPVLDFAIQLRDRTNAAVVFVDHLRKPPSGTRREVNLSPGYLLRGSGAKFARPDSVLGVQALDGCSVVSGCHRYGAPPEPFYFKLVDGRVDGRGYQLQICDPPAGAREDKATPEERIISWFERQPRGTWQTQRQIQAGVRIGWKSLGTGLVNLLGRNHLETEPGPRASKLWRLPPTVNALTVREEDFDEEMFP